jgi:hypothetical protein
MIVNWKLSSVETSVDYLWAGVCDFNFSFQWFLILGG